MHGFKGERVLMRIHIGERDRHDGNPLYQEIIELLRKRHYAGATVFRGITGFGASSRVHRQKVFGLSLDLPVVIECVETEENIRAILPDLDQMISGGMITLERVKVIMYRPHSRGAEGPVDWSLDVTGSWRIGTGEAGAV
jgi:PII-like signaling protein